MTGTEVTCPFCGAKKLVGHPCPECCKKGGAILKVEDDSIWRIWRPISEHRDFDDALKAAGYNRSRTESQNPMPVRFPVRSPDIFYLPLIHR